MAQSLPTNGIDRVQRYFFNEKFLGQDYAEKNIKEKSNFVLKLLKILKYGE